MSRSKKKIRFRAITTAVSEKENKVDAHRRFRRIVKQKIKLGEENLPLVRELSNVWHFDKDGKIYDAEMDEKLMRK